MADALCSSAIFEQMGGKMARELLSNSFFHHTSRVKLSKGKANQGQQGCEEEDHGDVQERFCGPIESCFREMFQADSQAQAGRHSGVCQV